MAEKNSWIAYVAVIALILSVVAVAVVLKGSVTGEAIFKVRSANSSFANQTGNFTNIGNNSNINGTWINNSIGNLSETVGKVQRGQINLSYFNATTNSTRPKNSTYVCYNGTLFASKVPCN